MNFLEEIQITEGKRRSLPSPVSVTLRTDMVKDPSAFQVEVVGRLIIEARVWIQEHVYQQDKMSGQMEITKRLHHTLQNKLYTSMLERLYDALHYVEDEDYDNARRYLLDIIRDIASPRGE